MLKRVRVDQKGDTDYLPGQFVDRNDFFKVNAEVKKNKGEQAQFEEIILGITKASLNTDSFLSAASFQETTKVLTDAALEGKKDTLNGLKENLKGPSAAAWAAECPGAPSHAPSALAPESQLQISRRTKSFADDLYSGKVTLFGECYRPEQMRCAGLRIAAGTLRGAATDPCSVTFVR
jgi:hypothetical protein